MHQKQNEAMNQAIDLLINNDTEVLSHMLDNRKKIDIMI